MSFRPVETVLRAPLVTAHGPVWQRSSWLVRATVPPGPASHAGYGEAAPLPGFGGGDPDRVVDALDAIARTLTQADPRMDHGSVSRLEAAWEAALPRDGAARASAAFALADLAARRAELPLAVWLREFGAGETEHDPGARGTDPEAPVPSVLVNGVIGALPPGAAVPEALRLVASGYTTLKVKVGGDPDADVARVAAVRTAVGAGVRLRLDANEGWAQDQAERVLQRLAAFDIEYVEQPVAREDIDGMARLRRGAVMAIAADEALLESGGPDAVEAAGAADVWVLKPVLLGGPFRTLALARRAALLGVRCVVTTAVDGGVGRLCALHVAAVIAGHGWDGGLAHGLGTGGLLLNDLVETAEPEKGRMPVPTLPGLGCADLGGTWTTLGVQVAPC